MNEQIIIPEPKSMPRGKKYQVELTAEEMIFLSDFLLYFSKFWDGMGTSEDETGFSIKHDIDFDEFADKFFKASHDGDNGDWR